MRAALKAMFLRSALLALAAAAAFAIVAGEASRSAASTPQPQVVQAAPTADVFRRHDLKFRRRLVWREPEARRSSPLQV
jgi:hypothetical protein